MLVLLLKTTTQTQKTNKPQAQWWTEFVFDEPNSPFQGNLQTSLLNWIFNFPYLLTGWICNSYQMIVITLIWIHFAFPLCSQAGPATGLWRRLITITVTSGLLAWGRCYTLFSVGFFQCSFTDHPRASTTWAICGGGPVLCMLWKHNKPWANTQWLALMVLITIIMP